MNEQIRSRERIEFHGAYDRMIGLDQSEVEFAFNRIKSNQVSQHFEEQFFNSKVFSWSIVLGLACCFCQIVFVAHYSIVEWIMCKYPNMSKSIIQYRVAKKLQKIYNEEESGEEE